MRLIILQLLFLTSITCTGQLPEFATARITDVTFGEAPRIVVAFGNSSQEIIQLNKFEDPRGQIVKYNTVDEALEAFDNIVAKNLKIINTFLSSMKEKGYEIDQMSTSISNGHFSFIIFRKYEE